MDSTVAHSTNVNLALRLTDATKLPMLLELLRHIDFIEAAETETGVPAAAPANGETAVADAFQEPFGMWQGRSIDAQTLRQEAFLRRTTHYDQQG